MVTVIAALGPSHGADWLTYQVVLPAVAVEGVGAVADPAPPAAVVYQSRFVPVAVNADAVAPWQYVTGEVTIGAAGVALIVTVIDALGPSHVPVVWLT